MCGVALDTPSARRHSDDMTVGRRLGAPTPRRFVALGAVALALLLAFGSCSEAPSDESGTELLELNRDREGVQLLGGQTGDGTGVADDPGRESLAGPCSEASLSRPLVASEVVTELGFSADDVIAWARAGVSSTLSWAPNDDLATLPETGMGRVEIGFEYAGANIRLHTPARIVLFEGRPTCGSWIEVDVTATLTTPGGALAERFPATLRASRASVVGFIGSLLQSELAGSLELRAAGIDGPLESVEALGTLTEHGSFGALFANYRLPVLGDPPGVLERRTVAVWPAASECPPGSAGTALPLGDDVRVIERTVAEWKEVFTDVGVTPLHWSDGARARVALDIQASTPACYSTRWALPSESLTYGTQILALSDDGRWDGGYLGLVRISSPAVPPSTYAALRVKATVPPDRAQSLGVTIASVEAESLTFELQLGRDVRADRPLEGGLRVTASLDLGCFDQPDLSAAQVDSCVAASTPELIGARIGESDDD
jgi:hypothetical protein